MSYRRDAHHKPYFEIEEREFTFEHEGFPIAVTVWNESATPQPQMLFDFNNVLNVYTMESLQLATGTTSLPYAIVSLLVTKGHNFLGLKERSYQTGETIVALTCDAKGDRFKVETGMKYQVTRLLGWTEVQTAVDDKPHEWLWTASPSRQQVSVLDPKSLVPLTPPPSQTPPAPRRGDRKGPDHERIPKPVYQILYVPT